MVKLAGHIEELLVLYEAEMAEIIALIADGGGWW